MVDTDDEVILLDDPILDATPFIEVVIEVSGDDYDEVVILDFGQYEPDLDAA
jgi:hypothetical protein